MAHTNARGTFLVRESEQNPGGFALSIKDYDQERLYHVKHYKIKPLDNNRGYFITTRQTFATLQDLVAGYQSTQCKGLCCQLTKPCQKPQPREGRSNALEYATRSGLYLISGLIIMSFVSRTQDFFREKLHEKLQINGL